MTNDTDMHAVLVGLLKAGGINNASVTVETPGPAGMAVIHLGGVEYRAKASELAMTLFGAKRSTIVELLTPYRSATT